MLTGIFEVMGIMVAHSLVLNGPGFLYLAHIIFWHIATGVLSEAVCRSSFIYAADLELATLLEKVCKFIFIKLQYSYYLYQNQILQFFKKSSPCPARCVLLA